MGLKVRILKGDTLKNLASLMEVSYRTILALNPQIKNPNLIRVGELLEVPDTNISRKVSASREVVWTAQHSKTPINTDEGNWGAWPAKPIQVKLPDDNTPANAGTTSPSGFGAMFSNKWVLIGLGVIGLALVSGKRR